MKENIEAALQKQTKHYDKDKRPTPTFEPGDKVWLRRKYIKTTRPCDKLDVKKLGPYQISEAVGSHAYRLAVPPSFRAHPVFHVSLLEPVKTSTMPRVQEPDPVEIPVEGETYQVEKIISRRKVRRRYEYLVRWKGFPPEDDTWQPESDLMADDLARPIVQEYIRLCSEVAD